MINDFTNWTPRPRPERVVIEGQYARLEPLDGALHGDDLFEASMTEGADDRFRYLFEAPVPRPDFDSWLAKAALSTDPMFWAVIDRQTGRTAGRQALMRIDTAHGVIEIGNILWGPPIARSRAATEALYLFAHHAFETLGYRRFEWKCNNLNEPSKRAAIRFGFTFEGIFRQHMVTKGQNRDTAWFAITDAEWPAVKARFGAWLDPSNFDAQGQQKKRLEMC